MQLKILLETCFSPQSENKLSVINPICAETFYVRKSVEELRAVSNRFNLPENFILYVGALSKNKGVENIIKALSIKRDLDLSLVVVGDGSERKNLLSLSKKHGLGERILWLNQQADPSQFELSAIYQMSKVTVLLSRYEGFGLPIIESLASRTPVITMNHSSLPEAADGGGYYLKSDDPSEVAFAIETILSDDELYNGLTDVGYQHSLNFKQEVKANELMSLYNSLLAR